jgi:two-component system chemotaxis response regulator CheB
LTIPSEDAMHGVQLADGHAPSTQLFPVVGLVASEGGTDALGRILSALPADFRACVLVVRHRTTNSPHVLIDRLQLDLLQVDLLQNRTRLVVSHASEGDVLGPGRVYVAGPDRHLLVTPGGTLHLSDDPTVRHACPSADCLFVSMAESLRERAIVVVLTGYDDYGGGGLEAVKQNGGSVIAQHPLAAERPGTPASAVATGQVDQVVRLDNIAAVLVGLVADGAVGDSCTKVEPKRDRVVASASTPRKSSDTSMPAPRRRPPPR